MRVGCVYARALRDRLRACLEIDCALLLIAMNCAFRVIVLAYAGARHAEASQLLTAPAGHYQPFKHPHVTRSPPI